MPIDVSKQTPGSGVLRFSDSGGNEMPDTIIIFIKHIISIRFMKYKLLEKDQLDGTIRIKINGDTNYAEYRYPYSQKEALLDYIINEKNKVTKPNPSVTPNILKSLSWL